MNVFPTTDFFSFNFLIFVVYVSPVFYPGNTMDIRAYRLSRRGCKRVGHDLETKHKKLIYIYIYMYILCVYIYIYI